MVTSKYFTSRLHGTSSQIRTEFSLRRFAPSRVWSHSCFRWIWSSISHTSLITGWCEIKICCFGANSIFAWHRKHDYSISTSSGIVLVWRWRGYSEPQQSSLWTSSVFLLEMFSHPVAFFSLALLVSLLTSSGVVNLIWEEFSCRNVLTLTSLFVCCLDIKNVELFFGLYPCYFRLSGMNLFQSIVFILLLRCILFLSGLFELSLDCVVMILPELCVALSNNCCRCLSRRDGIHLGGE